MEKKIGKIIIIILVVLALLTAGIFAYIKFSESNKIYREMIINNDEGTLSYNDLTVNYKKGEYLYFNASKNNMKNMLLYNMKFRPKTFMTPANKPIILDCREKL